MNNQKEHFLWVEKYRPKDIDSCILPDTTKSIFKGMVRDGNLTNLLLCGKPGQGKTTVAKALCNEIDADVLLINGSEERGIDTLRTKVKTTASALSLRGSKRVIIIDEADYLTAESQAAFRGIIEEFSKNTSFIFTCNHKNKIIDALHSRCSVVDFVIDKKDKPKLIQEIFLRIANILKNENVEFDKKVLGQVIINFFPDYRRTINELQKYSKFNNKIDLGILSHATDLNISSLIEFLKEKNFTKVREWLSQNSDVDFSKLYSKLYEATKIEMKSDSVPQAILHLGDYQYKHSFSADPEICFLACLVQIMVDCSWK